MIKTGAAPPAPTIRIHAERNNIEMGDCAVVTATVTRPNGPVAGIELWPYVNGRRWGAQAKTDAQGQATFLLPLPDPGEARIQVGVRPPAPIPDAHWIWANTTADGQTVYFRKTFTLAAAPRSAALHITCDDAFHAFLNGHEIASGGNFEQVRQATGLEKGLTPGRNVLTVEGHNGTGPAGLLAHLEIRTARGKQDMATDGSWEVFAEKPAGWPEPGAAPGTPATVLAPVGGGVWGSSLQGWPGLSPHTDFPIGLPLPANMTCSNSLRVQVRRRTLRVTLDPQHRVGMEWEPWFTPRNARWDTAEAVPLLGDYDSFQTAVIRQHALWMTEVGVDFLLVDWSNNLWDKPHWSERSPGVDELIRATDLLFDTYAQMRQEGIPVPQITFLLGLDNGPQTTMAALNEEMQWVYARYVRNPRYRGLWLDYNGKPLIVPFNGGGPAIRAGKPPVDETQFTVRWMASQLQGNHLERAGYWSWMDGVLHPIPTLFNGQAEALTVTPAFFGDGGWTYPQARGRRGGATYLEEFSTALKVRPRFLLINQWNEFAGQPDGNGYGPKHDQYVDCYTIPLSNDIEPTSTTACAYRGCGGWGFFYLNLTRALIQLYRQEAPDSTLLTVASPEPGQTVTGPTLSIEWTTLGRPAERFTLTLDGREIVRGLQDTRYALDISRLPPGAHTLAVLAEDAVTRFPLATTQRDRPLEKPVPVAVEVEFSVAREEHGRAGAREP